MPHSRAEIQLTGDWTKTLDGNDFILGDDSNDDKIVLFGTQSSLRLLSEAETYYVDGTFPITPSLFYQIFTIHIVKYNHSFPMVYALLPNKECYYVSNRKCESEVFSQT